MASSERAIVHLDLDSFFVSVERQRDPRLRGRPLLIGGDGDRGVVASCSYEARQYGVQSAMPMRTARRLCPQAIVLRGDGAAYMRKSEEVTAIIRERVPVFEKTSVDEFYVDLTGTERFFGAWKLATELRKHIARETGLPNSFGLSVNRTVSKMATNEAKPDGQLEVPRGMEKAFLAPKPIERIPGVGERTAQLLHSIGVARIADLQRMSAERLRGLLGEHGPVLWEKANGIDDSPVVPWHERKSISTERTFEHDTVDTVWLHSVLVAMAEGLTYQLRGSGQVAGCVAVKVRYADMATHTRQTRIPYTAGDHVVLPVVHGLFNALYDRRQRIRLIGVRFSDLLDGGHQLDAFADTDESRRLYSAVDQVRERFGSRSVVRAAGLGAHGLGRVDGLEEPPITPSPTGGNAHPPGEAGKAPVPHRPFGRS